MYIHLKPPHRNEKHCVTLARAAVKETRFLQKCLAYKLISSMTFCLKHDKVLFVPYGGETFADSVELLAAVRVVAALFKCIFGYNLFQASR